MKKSGSGKALRVCFFAFLILGSVPAFLWAQRTGPQSPAQGSGQSAPRQSSTADQAPGSIAFGAESWDPAQEFRQMQALMQNFFRNAFLGDAPWSSLLQGGQGAAMFRPALDLRETPSEYRVEVDLPGMRREQIRVHVQDNQLIIEGERRHEEVQQQEAAEGGRFYYQGRRFGVFQQSLRIPENVNTDRIQASYEQGVLTVRMPKTERTVPQARTIEIA